MTPLERAARAAGEVAATMESDVRHVLSERALKDVARAVLMSVREPDGPSATAGTKAYRGQLGDAYYWDNGIARSVFTAMIDAILNEEAEG